MDSYYYPESFRVFCEPKQNYEKKEIYQSNGDRLANLKARTIYNNTSNNSTTFPYKINPVSKCLVSANNHDNLLLITKGKYYKDNFY